MKNRNAWVAWVSLIVIFNILTLSDGFAQTPIVYPTDSGMVNVVTAYGADPTGNTDSTADIQAAVKANCGASGPTRTLYFPASTYEITSTINCINSSGHPTFSIGFQGAGPGLTILKLTNNNANFQSTSPPASVIHMNQQYGASAPNEGINNFVWDNPS
jgi:hypothetical protein